MEKEQARILIVRGGAIGDFILTLPAIAAIRSAFPGAHLTLLGYPRVAELAFAGGLVDEVRAIEAREMALFFTPRSQLPIELAEFFGSFALIVSYLYDLDDVFQINVRRCSTAQFVAAPHRPDESGGVHATEAFLKPLERLAIFDADPTPRLSLAALPPGNGMPSNVTPIGVGTRPCRWLAAHPGSGSDKKNWPVDRWECLLEHCALQPDLHLLMIGGEADLDRFERLKPVWPDDRLEVAFGLPLDRLARRMSSCDFFIGHDSGISHLAAAVGLSGLVLWGETSEPVWRPRAETIRVLKCARGLDSLAVDDVLPALIELLPADEDA